MSFVPTVKRRLTLPVLQLVIDQTRYVKITGAMHIGKEQKSSRSGEKTDAQKRAPATLCDIVNLETGEAAQLIVPAVLKSIFADEYANNAYVDLCFSVTKKAKQPGKDYFPYDVQEIEEPNPVQAAGQPAKMSDHRGGRARA